jgi:hypothetical protein
VYIYDKRQQYWDQPKERYRFDLPEGPTSEKRILIPTLLRSSASTQSVVTRRVRLLGHTPSLNLAFVEVCSVCV